MADWWHWIIEALKLCWNYQPRSRRAKVMCIFLSLGFMSLAVTLILRFTNFLTSRVIMPVVSLSMVAAAYFLTVLARTLRGVAFSEDETYRLRRIRTGQQAVQFVEELEPDQEESPSTGIYAPKGASVSKSGDFPFSLPTGVGTSRKAGSSSGTSVTRRPSQGSSFTVRADVHEQPSTSGEANLPRRSRNREPVYEGRGKRSSLPQYYYQKSSQKRKYQSTSAGKPEASAARPSSSASGYGACETEPSASGYDPSAAGAYGYDPSAAESYSLRPRSESRLARTHTQAEGRHPSQSAIDEDLRSSFSSPTRHGSAASATRQSEVTSRECGTLRKKPRTSRREAGSILTGMQEGTARMSAIPETSGEASASSSRLEESIPPTSSEQSVAVNIPATPEPSPVHKRRRSPEAVILRKVHSPSKKPKSSGVGDRAELSIELEDSDDSESEDEQ